jgi:predicted P-loop ATPase
MRTFALATAPARNSRHWQSSTITWEELAAWTEQPANQKECGNYVLGTLRGGRRTKATIVSRSAITLDADSPSPGLPELIEMTLGASIVHTTWRSSPDAPRYRVVLPTCRDVSPAEYQQISTLLMQRLGPDNFDPGSSQPERYMFKPSAPTLDWYQAWVNDGEPLDVDALLREALPVIQEEPTTKRDPFELGGVIGAFNRVYEEFQDVIDEYQLPYSQDGADRWVLVGADSAAGMGVVRPGVVFSHHAHDPAGGRACTAFDLVRLHRFGELDATAAPNTPVTRLPSQLAMLDLAAADGRVILELVGSDFTPTPDDPDWKLGLRLDRKGNLLDTIGNWDLICTHDPVMTTLLYNELTLSVEVRDDLPWRPITRGETFTGTDRAALCHYIEREYRLRPPRTLMDEFIATTAARQTINPVRDYLSGLKWDGVPRLETCLPGVTPTPYTRMVARKSLVAAVARSFEPGCKWDHTLVLFGSEGIGKSFWVDRMSRGYSATLGRIGDKDTLITMQRSWIMVSDEGYSLKKADVDVQKEFLTRTEDVFRMPYDREALAHPRHSVIWGTTNDEVFLRRQEGNRRFLIVHCENKVDFDGLTDEYIDQVWAEAVHAYRAGELLYLEEPETVVAAAEREVFIEEDAMAGVLQEYLDTLVPDDWDDLSPDSRLVWLQGRREGMVAPGTNPITRVCSIQLWVEALGKRMGDHRRQDLLEINTALKRVSGWAALPGRHRLPHYGPQLVFARTASNYPEPEPQG